MPLYRDKHTGKVVNFDHEPTEQELDAKFGNAPQPMAAPQVPAQAPQAAAPQAAPQADPGESYGHLARRLGLPIGGFIAGGALGGPMGAIAGATAGSAANDIYNASQGERPPNTLSRMVTGDQEPVPTFGGVLRDTGEGALETAAGAYLTPLLSKLPGPPAIKTMLGGGIGGAGLGSLFGHTQLGALVGSGFGAYGALAPIARGAGNLAEFLTTPRLGGAAEAAASEAGGMNPRLVESMRAAGIDPASPEAQKYFAPQRIPAKTLGSPKPGAAPQASGPGLMDRALGGLRSAGSSLADMAGKGVDAIKGGAQSLDNYMTGAEPPPPSPRSPLALTKTPGDIAERLGVTGQPAYAQPDMSRNPEMSWSADVSAAPQRTPQLSQTSPTDPQMPWEEHTSRSAPRRSSTGGQSFGSVEVSSPLQGLKGAVPEVAPTGPTPIGVHDEGLQRFIEGGGTPEAWLRLGGGKGAGGTDPNFSQRVGPEGFGPNTVGAAEKAKFLPQTVDEAKGLSLAEQEAWAKYKASNPGVTDGMLNSWYTSHQLGANPNEGMDVNAMADKLTELLRNRK